MTVLVGAAVYGRAVHMPKLEIALTSGEKMFPGLVVRPDLTCSIETSDQASTFRYIG